MEHENELLAEFRAYKADGGTPKRSAGFDAADCAKTIKQALSGQSGTFLDEVRSMGRHYVKIGPWLIQTVIGVGVPPHYSHSIFASPTASLCSGFSFLSSIGINSQTALDRVGPGDEADAARSILLLVRTFLDAVPNLLADLDHDEVEMEIPAPRSPTPLPAPRLFRK
jgi:hypothetical protein